MTCSRQLAGDALIEALRNTRRATLLAALDLHDAQWRMPYDEGLQPTAWDLGHIAWFAEFWLHRGPHHLCHDGHMTAAVPSALGLDDRIYDSARIGHQERWQVPLLARGALVELLEAQLERTIHAVRHLPTTDAALYFPRLVLYHEGMHAEALAWTRGIIAACPPAGAELPRLPAASELRLPGGACMLGWPAAEPGFAFDNEREAHAVQIAPLSIDRTLVRNAQFAAFVAERGYARAEFWPGPAAAWLAQHGKHMPSRWRQGPAGIEVRWFHQWRPMVDDEPLLHVSAFEAEAFARWRKRRLPTAAEWEYAAEQLHWGRSAWEWTSDAFSPYANFRPGPYVTYSAPWFAHQRECRGGAFATLPYVQHRRYRNFFAPHRTDVFCGFRTAAAL